MVAYTVNKNYKAPSGTVSVGTTKTGSAAVTGITTIVQKDIPQREPTKTPDFLKPKPYVNPFDKKPAPPSGGGGGGGGFDRGGGEVGGGGGGTPPNIIPDPSSPTGYSDPLGQPVSVAPIKPLPSYGGGGSGSGGGGTTPSQDFARTQQSNYNKEIENLNKQYAAGQFNYKGYNERAKSIAEKYNTAIKNYEELVQKAEQERAGQQVSTIYQKPTGTFKGVPTYETRIKTEATGEDRLATQEEYQYLKTQTTELQASTKKDIPLITPVLRKVSEIRGGVSGRIEELKQENKIIGTADALLTYAEATQPATKIKTLITSGGDFISQYGTKGGAFNIYGKEVSSKSLFYTGLTTKVIGGMIPTSLTQLGEYAALGITGTLYPRLTLAAIEGYSAYSFATAQTPEEQVSAIVTASLPLAFGGLKEFKTTKKITNYLKSEPVATKDSVLDYVIKELNLEPPSKTYSEIFKGDTAIVFEKGKGIIGEELKLIEPTKANVPIKPREILIELDITTKEPSAYSFKKGQRLGEPINLIEQAKANIQSRTKFTQKQIDVNQLARDIRSLEKAEQYGLLKQDILPETRELALKNLREQQIEQIRIESAIESRLEPNKQEILLDKQIRKAGLQKKELPNIRKLLLKNIEKQRLKDIEQIRIESAIESRLEPNKLFETRVKIEDLLREKNLLKDVINEPSQLGLKKFKEDLLIKEQQIPKPETLKSLDILQQEIKFNKDFGLDIRELALKRLREQKPLEIIPKPKFEKRIKTIKDYIDEPVIAKEIKSNDQKLIQVLREPEIIKPERQIPIETKQESLIPQGIFEGMTFEGKIQKFGDTGKIKSFGELQGRIPKFEDVQVNKQFDLSEGLLKDVGLKAESIFDNKQKDILITGIREKEKLKQPERTIQISEEVQKSFNLFYQPIREVQLQRQPQSQSFKQPQSFSFAQPQIEAQLQRQYQRQRYREENLITDISKFETRILKRFKEDKRKKRTFKQTPLYSVQIRRRGKFTPIRTDLTRSQALQFGSERALGSLARTFRIAPTGKTKEMFGIEEGDIPQLGKFREFKIRKGKQIATPRQFTQLTEFNLQSLGEKAEIKQSKLMKNILQ